MSEDKQVLNEITSLIYQWLFGMTRTQMIMDSYLHKPDGWQDLHEDKDENMRDHLSIAALNCLSGAEKAITDYINKYGMGLTETHIAEYKFLIQPYKVDGLVIWSDEV